MYLGSLLEEGKIDLPRIAEILDGLGHPGRLATTRAWGADVQSRLFTAVKGHKPLTLDDFVAPEIEPLVEVIHHGKNSLPAFTHFQKRFCKPAPVEGAEPKAELLGYNHNPGWETAFIGPGYYVVHAPENREDSEGEIDIDYTRLPTGKPASWPEIVSNERLISHFVYSGMVDVMRGVSKHVSIGRARKKGKWMDAWFVLCREDRA